MSLAIFSPLIGLRSETFIRRHIQDLLPGRTVAVAGFIKSSASDGHWSVDCPTLELGQSDRPFLGRAFLWGARKLRLPRAGPASSPVARFLKKHKVKVIMSEYLDASMQWLPVAQELGIRFFGHAHGYDVSSCLREEKWKTEYLRYNQSAGVITVSSASKNRLIEMGISAAKIHVIPCSVTVPFEARTRSASEIVRCLAVGRMVAKKAPILTLDAFRRASEKIPKLRLDYVGAGELLSAAQQFVSAFGLHEKVTLHKGQPSEVVQNLMSESDIFLQHSMTDHETGDEEGLPVAILEAMAQSLPVISTRHAGIPEAVMETITGFLVNEGDSVTMAERIVQLAHDGNLRQQMGVAGWQRAREEFTWEKERSALLELMGLESEAK